MWNNLSREWQTAFGLAWEAFRNGSIPIGAVIFDEAGNVLSTGRNHMGENLVPNPRTAHAETLCVRNLDIAKYRDYRNYHLYTTMEPCPMCLGVIIMGGICNIHVAAKDRYCGALHYLDYDPYLQSKNVQVWMDAEEMGRVQIVQQAYHEYRRYAGDDSIVLRKIAMDYPEEVVLGKALFQQGYLDECARNDMSYAQVSDSIVQMLMKT